MEPSAPTPASPLACVGNPGLALPVTVDLSNGLRLANLPPVNAALPHHSNHAISLRISGWRKTNHFVFLPGDIFGSDKRNQRSNNHFNRNRDFVFGRLTLSHY